MRALRGRRRAAAVHEESGGQTPSFASNCRAEVENGRAATPVPDSPSAVLAYRSWAVVNGREGPELASPQHRPPSCLWRPFERLQARCLSRRGALTGRLRQPCDATTVPSVDHSCGIYGLKDVDFPRIDSLLEIAPALPRRRVHAVGQVWLWGKVIEGSEGWRGQYAYPARFIKIYGGDMTTDSELWYLQALSDAYGVVLDSDIALGASI